jgi:HNH endonuclease
MPEQPCVIQPCPYSAYIRGMCTRHYDRERRLGDPRAGGRMRASHGSRSICSVEDCQAVVVGLGYCGKHLQRFHKYGDPLVVQSKGSGRGVPVADRFAAAVKDGPPAEGFAKPHRLWTRPPNSSGYGTITVDGRSMSAHTLALKLAGVDIPDGYEPDHLCGLRLCVEVTHMEVVTASENRRRAALVGVEKRRREAIATYSTA